MSSQFGGTLFRVQSSDGRWWPNPEMDEDGRVTYQCRAWFATDSDRKAMARKVCIVTWKRPLGTTSTIGHMDAGPGDFQLRVPDSAGVAKTYRAVLVRMNSIEGYGIHAGKGFMADLEFVILNDLWAA